MIRVLGGLIILFLALVLQFSLATAGIRLGLSFAILISFAFLFEFWELAFFVLLTVFILNWQPAASPEILTFALFPLAVYFCRNILHWRIWLENLLALALGFLVLYFAAAPAGFFLYWQSFLLDVAAGALLSGIVFLILYRPK